MAASTKLRLVILVALMVATGVGQWLGYRRGYEAGLHRCEQALDTIQKAMFPRP